MTDLKQLKAQMVAAEAARAEAYDAYIAARAAHRAARIAYRKAHKALGDTAYRAHEAKRAFDKAFEAQKRSND